MMETNLQTNCFNCFRPLTQTGYFCGGCLTQVRCKSCGSSLEQDDTGCVHCGTPKDVRAQVNTISHQNINTFRFHETATDRTIEATFSDDVAKDLAGTLRDAAASGRMKTIASNIPSSSNSREENEEVGEFTEVEVLNNEKSVLKTETINKSVTTHDTKPEEYPTLKAIAMKNLPGTEIEWIVVYAFYASDYGKMIFTRDDIINLYVESNRFNKDTTKRDLSTNLKRNVVIGYINPLQTGYSILEEGIAKAKEIIARTSSSSPRTKVSSKTKKGNEDRAIESGVANGKKASKSTKTLKRLTNINFEPTGKESLKVFFGNYAPTNDYERNLLFVYYLQNVLEIKEITFDHIYSCYDILELRISENLPQTIRNTASSSGWIETKQSILFLTIKGSNQIKAWNKKD